MGPAWRSVIGTQGPPGSFNIVNLVIRFNKGQSHIRETTEYLFPMGMKVQVTLVLRPCTEDANGTGMGSGEEGTKLGVLWSV